MADHYAQVACTDFFHRSPEKERALIEDTKQQIKLYEEDLTRPEKSEGEHSWIKDKLLPQEESELRLLEEELKLLETQSAADKETPFPIVFGLERLQEARRESFHSSVKVGHEIPLRSKLKTMYAPIEQMELMEGWRQKLDLAGVDIYPLEDVRLIRKINPDYRRMQENMKNMRTE